MLLTAMVPATPVSPERPPVDRNPPRRSAAAKVRNPAKNAPTIAKGGTVNANTPNIEHKPNASPRIAMLRIPKRVTWSQR